MGLVPWLITRWRFHRPLPGWTAACVLGAALVAGGVMPVGSAFAEFVKAGGTLMPVAPTKHVVVIGFNQFGTEYPPTYRAGLATHAAPVEPPANSLALDTAGKPAQTLGRSRWTSIRAWMPT